MNLPNELITYRITETIFSSDNSVIYRAHTDGKSIIIKELNRSFPTANEIARFEYEFKLAQRCSGDEIISVYDYRKEGDKYFFLMEDIDAHDLKSQIKEMGAHSVEIFLPLAISMVKAIQTVHAEQVIHKDINPSNLLVKSNGTAVKLIDFGISSMLPKEQAVQKAPELLEGTLPYLSPEQTGRINRSIDYRTDFYSLGVTLYELITGRLPFTTEDKAELVHAHIAGTPQSPSEINPNIPQILSKIILKLMAKDGADRYQSASGLLNDLLQCQKGIADLNALNFEPGENDIADRLTIPEMIYGRESEVAQLEEALERVSSGNTELHTIAGFSGVGKTAVVRELYKNLSKKRGYFISGKYDQFQHNLPYSAVVQAFSQLVQQLLTESESELALWKTKILEAVGTNGAVITDVLPELELIIGKQNPVAKLGASETQKRFDLIFQTVLSLFASPEHPVVLFLDDLQWVDSASLHLLEVMASSQDNAMLLILAYRDNEVDSTHSFSMMLSKLQKKSIEICEMKLASLGENSIGNLLADTLSQSADDVSSLTALIMEKTGGNPFFVDQFLLTLYQEDLLVLIDGQWQWDMEKIRGKNMTDNVIDLMVQKLQKLPASAQKTAQLSAMIGSTFDLAMLSTIYEKSEAETFADLMPLLTERLVLPLSEIERKKKKSFVETKIFQFLHDRVQQASYALVAEEQKAPLHLTIARLISESGDKKVEENLFELTNHYNKALELIDESERITLIKLNLRSGIKSRGFTSYDGSFSYLKTAFDLLPQNVWSESYDLAFEVSLEYCQSGFLATHFEEANKALSQMIQKVKTPYERAKIYHMQGKQYVAMERASESLLVYQKGLKELHFSLSLSPSPLSLISSLLTIKRLKRKKTISEIVNHSLMEDENLSLTTEILAEMILPAFLAENEALFALLSLKQVVLSLKHGNSKTTPFGYIAYGIMLNGMGRYKSAFEAGQIGIQLSKKFDSIEGKSAVQFMYTFYIHFLNAPLVELEEQFKKAIEFGKESGEFFWLSWSFANAGVRCPTLSLQEENKKLNLYFEQCEKAGYADAVEALKTLVQQNKALLGLTENIYSLSDEIYDVKATIEKMNDADKSDVLAPLFLFRCKVLYLHGKPLDAHKLLPELDKRRKVLDGNADSITHAIYAFLIEATVYSQLKGKEKKRAYKRLKWEIARIIKRANHYEYNFALFKDLMGAELAKINGKHIEAQNLFISAISKAVEQNNLQYIAVFNERFALYWYELDNEQIGNFYMKEAHYRYQIWGATVKVGLLEERYPFLIEKEGSNTISNTLTQQGSTQIKNQRGANWLDLESLLKATATLAGEIELESLLQKMLSIAIENGGAERGVLLLPQKESWYCEAEAFSDNRESIIASRSIQNSDIVPVSIINYVSRTEETIVLSNAQESEQFKDPYLVEKKSKSILALPMIEQGKIIAILYLENSLGTDIFTPERTETLRHIATQAAVSIEKSQLIAKEKKLLENLHHSEKLQAIGQLASGIVHDFNNQIAAISGCAEIIKMVEDKDSEVTEMADNILKSVKHSTDLTKQILAFARKRETELSSISVTDLVQEVQKLLRHTVESSIEISAQLGSNSTIIGDHSQLQNALLNLGINARDAMEGNGGKITYSTDRITVDTEWNLANNRELKLGDYALISVQDNGSGIPEEIRQTIFEPFYTTKEEGKGTGMGLAAVLGTVESHGGAVLLESEVGSGTMISLLIPCDT